MMTYQIGLKDKSLQGFPLNLPQQFKMHSGL